MEAEGEEEKVPNGYDSYQEDNEEEEKNETRSDFVQ